MNFQIDGSLIIKVPRKESFSLKNVQWENGHRAFQQQNVEEKWQLDYKYDSNKDGSTVHVDLKGNIHDYLRNVLVIFFDSKEMKSSNPLFCFTMARVGYVEKRVNETLFFHQRPFFLFQSAFRLIVDCWLFDFLLGALDAHVELRTIDSKFCWSKVSILFILFNAYFSLNVGFTLLEIE